jgi:hypothetical protein
MFGRTKHKVEPVAVDDGIVEALERLWQTKRQNINLLEQWLSATIDSEIKAALPKQLVEERTHLRLIGERIRALGGRINANGPTDWRGYAFSIVGNAANDLYRLVALYRGTKSYSTARCRKLFDAIDEATKAVVIQIVLDEERQIRWAENRISRLWTRDKDRDCNFIVEHVHRALEAAWERPWRRITGGQPLRKIA